MVLSPLRVTLRKIPISLLCIRRKQQKSGLQKEPVKKIQEHTYKACTIKEPAKENPKAATHEFPFMGSSSQLINLLIFPRTASKSGKISHVQLLPGALCFSSEREKCPAARVRRSWCVCRGGWCRNCEKSLFSTNYWATPQGNTQNLQLTTSCQSQGSSFGDSEANPLNKQKKEKSSTCKT